MARPKKQKELKRNHHIMLRLNDTEYDIVTENAQTANLPVAEYARKQDIRCKTPLPQTYFHGLRSEEHTSELQSH